MQPVYCLNGKGTAPEVAELTQGTATVEYKEAGLLTGVLLHGTAEENEKHGDTFAQ